MTNKNHHKIACLLILFLMIAVSACKKNNSAALTDPPIDYYEQVETTGRPLIRTILVSPTDVAAFNTTIPAAMPAAFAASMQANLLKLNPGYTTNFLSYNAAAFMNLFATDELAVNSLVVPTFYSATVPANSFSGRNLTDDVMDTELKLIFGGPSGTSNPGLISDHVNANDKAFTNGFPYEASPW
jgi:hypothetical protein